MNTRSIFKRIFLLVQPLLVGNISSLLAVNIGKVEFKDSIMYKKVATRSLISIPPYIFPIVWTTLYLFMGYAAYRIYSSENSGIRSNAIIYNQIQLFFNFTWSIVFFGYGMVYLSLINILLLLFFVLKTIKAYKEIDKQSFYLLIPYLTWLLFATYLNFLAF